MKNLDEIINSPVRVGFSRPAQWRIGVMDHDMTRHYYIFAGYFVISIDRDLAPY